MRAHLDFSLERLKNKHSLFTIDTDLKLPTYSQPNPTKIEERMQTALLAKLQAAEGNRRPTVVQERSWINEYSSINLENIHSQALIGSLKRANSKADSAFN